MVEVVHHLHQLGVMHRDIKPENFLLTTPGDDAVLKLCDFGLSAYWRAALKPSVSSVSCCHVMICRIFRKKHLACSCLMVGCWKTGNAGLSAYQRQMKFVRASSQASTAAAHCSFIMQCESL